MNKKRFRFFASLRMTSLFRHSEGAERPKNLVLVFSCLLLLTSCILTPTLIHAEELPYSITDITSGDAVDFYPEFSPDGKQIVFSSKTVDGSYFTDMHLWIMDADGNNRRQVTSKSAMYLQPTFTPDGKKIIFVSNMEDGLWDIWSMKINGSEFTRLTKNNQKEFFPIVTADGKNLIFIGRYFGTDSVFVMDMDGNNLKRLSSGGNGDSFPTICSDGKEIIFSTTRLGNSNLWAIDREGEEYKRLTFEDTIEFSPSCSPDGTKIAYVAIEGGAKTYSKARKGFEFKEISYRERSFDIWMINRAGTDRRRLAKNIFETGHSMNLFKSVDVIEGINYYHLSWHTDGKRLALTRWNKDRPGSRISILSFDNNIFEKQTDDETPVREFSLLAERELTSGNWDDLAPSFAPDGKSIVFASNRSGSWDIWNMELNGEHLRQITKGDGDEFAPVYSPDGKEIAFLRSQKPEARSQKDETNFENLQSSIFNLQYSLWIMKNDGSSARQITRNIPIKSYPAWNPNGKEIAYIAQGKDGYEICIYNLESSKAQRLITTHDSQLTAHNPQNYPFKEFLYRIGYNPSGDKITFESNRSGNIEIWTMKSNGTNLARLTNGDSPHWNPIWSPDGKMIAYTTDKLGEEAGLHNWRNYNIWVANPETQKEMLITGEEQIDWNPVWSPDGKKIVYVTNRSGEFKHYSLWVLYLK